MDQHRIAIPTYNSGVAPVQSSKVSMNQKGNLERETCLNQQTLVREPNR